MFQSEVDVFVNKSKRENDYVVNIKRECGTTSENTYLVKSKEWSKMKNVSKPKAQREH